MYTLNTLKRELDILEDGVHHKENYVNELKTEINKQESEIRKQRACILDIKKSIKILEVCSEGK